MSLIEELAGDQSQSGGRGCVVCRWLADRDDADEFIAALKDNTWQTATIWRAMKRRSADFGPSALGRHRKEHL